MRNAAALAPEPPPGLLAPPVFESESRRDGREALVIVGNGMVSHRLCRKLVELGARDRYRVVVFGEECRPAYDRVHLTELFSSRDHDDSLVMSPREWYSDHDIDLKLNHPVICVDRGRRFVRSLSGVTLEYDWLVFATGSVPFVPPIPGADAPGIFVYRRIEDLREIRACSRSARRAAVIGGGLLGLEAARALHNLGLATTIVEVAIGLMAQQLDRKGSDLLEREVVALGIRVRTDTRTIGITDSGQERTLHFANGDSLTADLVVIAAGIRPRSELAEACGLARCRAGGIQVDDRLRTSDPHVYAIGECASHASRVYGLVAPGYQMADVLAANLMGGSVTFSGGDVTARLKLLGVDVATSGEALDDGEKLTFEAGGSYRVLRVRRGRLTGALGVGDWPDFSRIQEATTRKAKISSRQITRFRRTGELWPASQDRPIAEWPAEAIVCNCLTLTRGQLSFVCAQGVQTVESLAERTGASTLCGSCRPMLARLTGAVEPIGTAKVLKGLLVASAVALAAAFVVLLAVPVAFVDTVQGGPHLDLLWRDGFYRQASGFSILGLCVASLMLSVRKRWRRCAFGSWRTWQAIHALVGVLALAGLAVHTGLRLGHNLNFVLSVSFLLASVLGATAGGVMATPAASRSARLRACMATAHVIAWWPFPVLLAFHILSVYYF
jgi:nitrite reductase (NADH) large subunit